MIITSKEEITVTMAKTVYETLLEENESLKFKNQQLEEKITRLQWKYFISEGKRKDQLLPYDSFAGPGRTLEENKNLWKELFGNSEYPSV